MGNFLSIHVKNLKNWIIKHLIFIIRNQPVFSLTLRQQVQLPRVVSGVSVCS